MEEISDTGFFDEAPSSKNPLDSPENGEIKGSPVPVVRIREMGRGSKKEPFEERPMKPPSSWGKNGEGKREKVAPPPVLKEPFVHDGGDGPDCREPVEVFVQGIVGGRFADEEEVEALLPDSTTEGLMGYRGRRPEE